MRSRGSAFGYARPFGLESSYDTVTTVEGTVNRTGAQLSDVGGTIGGPIRTDRLFFFGAVDPQWQSDKFIAPDDFPLHSLGEVNRDRHLVNYAGKVTWQPTSSHHFDVSVFGDPAKGDNGPQRSGSLLGQTNSGYSSLEFGGHNQTVHYDGVLNRHLLVEGSFGRALNRIVETPSVNEWQVLDFRVTPTVNSGGLGFYEAGNRSEAWQAQAKGTTIFAAAGEHQVRFGVSYDHLDFSQLQQYHRSDIHRAERPANRYRRRRRDHPRPGLRADLPRAAGEPHVLSSDDAELQRVLRRGLVEDRQLADDPARCPLRAGDPVGDADKGLLAQEQLGAAHRRRLGPDEDRQGEGVRQLRPLLRTRAERPGRARSLVGRLASADYFDANLTKPVPDGTVTTNATNGKQTITHFRLLGAGGDTIDPNTKLSYYNEWVVGSEYSVLKGIDVGVRYIHRDIGRVLEDVQAYPSSRRRSASKVRRRRTTC